MNLCKRIVSGALRHVVTLAPHTFHQNKFLAYCSEGEQTARTVRQLHPGMLWDLDFGWVVWRKGPWFPLGWACHEAQPLCNGDS